MQKPLSESLQHDLNTLFDSAESFIYMREDLHELIMVLLTETYNALNKLDEARFKYNLPKLEHDRSNIQAYIDHYKNLHDIALENEDPNLAWRYMYVYGLYELFQKDPAKTLSMLKVAVINAKINEQTPEDIDLTLQYIKTHDPKNYEARQRYIDNLDVCVDLFKQLEGYQVTHDLIVKSSALRIFRFFNVVTKVQKKALAKNTEYLFSTLGEIINIDPKRAGSIKQIGEFNGFALYDYLGNKKNLLHDFGLDEIFDKVLLETIVKLEEVGNKDYANRLKLGRTAMKLSLVTDVLIP